MIRVQRKDFDIGRELSALTAGKTRIGGLCSFVGLVRDMAGDSGVGAMTLEHYPGMTEKRLAEIEAEARSRWPLDDSLIIHRYGRLAPGDRIVLVATPFWKLEETDKGAAWVDAKPGDDAAAVRWTKMEP